MLQEEGCKEETCYKGNKLTETACVVSGGETIVSWELEMYDFLDESKIMTGHDGLEGERPGLVEKRNSQAYLKAMIWGSFTRGVVIEKAWGLWRL